MSKISSIALQFRYFIIKYTYNMDKYIIKGGVRLNGEVNISGAKNATLGILAASILCDEDVTIDNVPDISDVNCMLKAIKSLGAKVEKISSNTYTINGKNINKTELSDPDLKNIRATYYFVGALLAKFRHAKVVAPGGCNIGLRPIDLHLKGFETIGAKAIIEDGYIVAKAEAIVGDNIYFDTVSVGATINVMLASVFCMGTTTMRNVSKEPHVVDVANFLNAMGANIRGAGTDTIKIKGVSKLHSTNYTIIPDQIEAGTYMILAAITKGDITVKNVIPKHLESISAKLMDIGNNVMTYDEAVRVIGNDIQIHTSIKTLPYPGFPTDLQPQIACLLSTAEGQSKITETIFENRFRYVSEVIKMGAKITINDNELYIEGVKQLSGKNLVAPDLRAGAALVTAALAADGFSTIDNIEYIERGYENFISKLQDLGAIINKITEYDDIEKFIKENN